MNHPSAISHQPSAISHQPSAISHQPSAISHQPSMIAMPQMQHRRIPHVALAALGLCLVSCSAPKGIANAPATAEKVDLARYTGRWHEIARLPAPFQKADEAAIAVYGMNADGTVSVHNIAVRRDGSQRGIKGSAKVLNPPANTKLAVRFDTWFGPLIPMPKEGNYWILHVDALYQEAIVGTPDRKFLWLLARTPKISEQRQSALIAKAEALGFDVARVIKTARE